MARSYCTIIEQLDPLKNFAMATFFGEVVLDSSRAVDEDDDEADNVEEIE